MAHLGVIRRVDFAPRTRGGAPPSTIVVGLEEDEHVIAVEGLEGEDVVRVWIAKEEPQDEGAAVSAALAGAWSKLRRLRANRRAAGCG